MKTEYSKERNCWRAVVVLAAILGACGPVEDGGIEEDGLGATEQGALTGVSLGMSAGGIFVGVDQSLNAYSEQFLCENFNLGSKWIRIHADLPGVDKDNYQRVVQKAHAKGMKVLVTVPAKYCDNETDVDTFTTGYVAHLNDLATTIFTGAATVDAYEIGSEPNVMEATGCGDSVNRYRVAPAAFASLLRRAWDWKQTGARTELIVSGGLKDVYTTQPYWNSLANAPAFTNGTGKIRPFDYFGVHPYNNANMDYSCINAGYTTCFTGYKNTLRSGLQAAATKMNTATGTTDTKLFVTEFGFQVSGTSTCTGVEMCTLLDSVNSNSIPYYQLAAAMDAAGNSFALSGVTPIAIWRDYRDNASGAFGLRGVWDSQAFKYRVKTAGWNKFRSLAGGAGSTNPESCWAKGSYYKVDFENGSDLRTTNAGDWAYGYDKGECAPGERIMGLSKSITNGWARRSVCYKDPLDSGRYLHPVPFPQNPVCTVRNVEAGDDRGATPTTSQDWDAGNYRAECAPNEYVAGVAQSLDHKLSHVLCCPSVNVSATSCEVLPFGGADNRQTTDSDVIAWDSSEASYRGECGVGRYVAGVSRTPAGQPSALLCCYQ